MQEPNMSASAVPVNDMAATVKSRELQRAIQAEMAGDRRAAARHFLAAAHLELVLAEDYAAAGVTDMELRSRVSAASCLWRAGQQVEAKVLFESLMRDYPTDRVATEKVISELEREYGNGSP
jgi:hypothetical protein